MIALFSLRLICGMSLMWLLMPRKEVTSGFFRIQMLVTLGLAVLATLTLGRLASIDETTAIASLSVLKVGCVLIAVCSFAGSVMWLLERRKAGTIFALAAFLLSLVELVLGLLTQESITTFLGWMTPVSDVATSATLGGAMVGMLLGHWYLTTPTMTTLPLNRINYYFGLVLILRLIISLICLMIAWQEVSAAMAKPDGAMLTVWLALRWLAGIIAPLVLVVMTWKILKYRNTQSATGVLFVAVILTLIGELSATLLFQELKIPL